MTYVDLGPVTVKGQSDSLWQRNPYGLGTGWDVVVSASTSALEGVGSGGWPTQESFECYQISIDGPVGSSFAMWRNLASWNFVDKGWQNYNDPQQPMLLRTGDEVYFFWTFPYAPPPYTPTLGSNVQPTVTMWMRYYEPDVP